MKILIAGLQSRYEQYLPDLPITKQVEMVFCKRSLSDEVFAAAAPEAAAAGPPQAASSSAAASPHRRAAARNLGTRTPPLHISRMIC